MNKNLLARHETSAHNHMKFYKCFSVVALLLATSATLVAPKSSFASCKEAKPKDWTAGEGIKVTTPVPAPNPIVVCVNQSTTVSVSASDKDHWEIRCKEDNRLEGSDDEGDVLKYKWTGSGIFSNSTSASTGWTAPATAGTYDLICTIDDIPSAIPKGQTGNRDDKDLPYTVKVCVVDPGTAPTAVSEATDKKIVIPIPAGADANTFGETAPRLISVESVAMFDCATKKWKLVVTKAEVEYTIWWRLLPGPSPYQEASAAAANKDNYCEMLKSLGSRAARNAQTGGDRWWVEAAVKAHEEAHASSIKPITDKYLPAAKSAIEALTIDHTCGKTAAEATAELKAKSEYNKAITKMQLDFNDEWATQGVRDHVEPTGASSLGERPIIDLVVTAIKNKATNATPQWAPCTP